MNFVEEYFEEVMDTAYSIDKQKVEDLATALANTRDINEGRVFVLGVGGSAGNASHMVNDLRKLCGIEAYSPTDNASEITARTNDEGFDTIFEEYLRISRFSYKDAIFVLSVGGGNEEKNVSVGLIKAIKHAREKDGTVLSIVGKPDGYAAQRSDVAVVVPIVDPARITPHSEAFQAVVWHCLVSHPKLQVNKTKW
jgi:D-sedoheptulose 7-phosphate isomerase